ncbi:MAG: hypothetical protein Q7S61_00290 [bacterium]|nr:hypothetical protein [bacterium]
MRGLDERLNSIRMDESDKKETAQKGAIAVTEEQKLGLYALSFLLSQTYLLFSALQLASIPLIHKMLSENPDWVAPAAGAHLFFTAVCALKDAKLCERYGTGPNWESSIAHKSLGKLGVAGLYLFNSVGLKNPLAWGTYGATVITHDPAIAVSNWVAGSVIFGSWNIAAMTAWPSISKKLEDPVIAAKTESAIAKVKNVKKQLFNQIPNFNFQRHPGKR